MVPLGEQLEESERSEDPCPSVLGGKKKGRKEQSLDYILDITEHDHTLFL